MKRSVERWMGRAVSSLVCGPKLLVAAAAILLVGATMSPARADGVPLQATFSVSFTNDIASLAGIGPLFVQSGPDFRWVLFTVDDIQQGDDGGYQLDGIVRLTGSSGELVMPWQGTVSAPNGAGASHLDAAFYPAAGSGLFEGWFGAGSMSADLDPATGLATVSLAGLLNTPTPPPDTTSPSDDTGGSSGDNGGG